MISNGSLYILCEFEIFKELADYLEAELVWCEATIFLYTKDMAILFTDLIQEVEVDIFLYDRNYNAYTYNMYGIEDSLLTAKEKTSVSKKAFSLMSEIDFERLGIKSLQKKESIAFALSLLRQFGRRIFATSLSAFPLLANKPTEKMRERWNKCMANHGSHI
jgi:hypothetical protein